ncbi:MAG: class I SAM-dependent methyltransferase [Thermoproteota archaeon]
MNIKRKIQSARKLIKEGGFLFLIRFAVTKYVVKPMDAYFGISLLSSVLSSRTPFLSSHTLDELPLVAQDEVEFLEFIELLKKEGVKEVLEIGTFRGGTSYLFYKLLNASVTTLDLNNSWFFRKVLSFVSRGQIRGIRGNSHSYETLKKVSGKNYDLLFIDGDHSYEGVKNDFEMYSKLARIVAFHDIFSEEGVSKFWSELKASGAKTVEIVNRNNQRPLGIGILFSK